MTINDYKNTRKPQIIILKVFLPDVTNEIIFCINIRLKILNFEYVLSFTAVVQEEEIKLKSTYRS